LQAIIEEEKDSLQQASYDQDHDEYMVDSQLQVCIFDRVKDWYVGAKIPNVNPLPKSNDALFFGNEESFFIEFKNGKIDNAENFNLYKKIYDSLLILFDLDYSDPKGRKVNSISYTRANMNYILVYNEGRYHQAGPTRQTREGFERQNIEKKDSIHRDKLYKKVRNLANEELIKFGLDQFDKYLFKNVYTFTATEFQEKFVSKVEDVCPENFK